MIKERFKSIICADIMLKKIVDGKQYILLMKRKNTGSNDGEYELPGGHLEINEDIFDAMIREVKEELLIDLNREDIKLIHLLHHYTGERLNFIFEADGTDLNPKIGEKNKCSELIWVNIESLPIETTSKVKKIIDNILKDKFYDKL